MANNSKIWGFRPVRYLGGAPFNGQVSLYAFSASQANDAYIGDMVQMDTTNRSIALTDAYYPGAPCVQPVTAAITTNAFRGVIAGLIPEPEYSQTAAASLGLRYRKASTQRYVWIVEDPMVVFEAEESGNSYTSTSNNAINKTTDVGYTAGSTITGISGAVLAGASYQTAAVRPWRCVRFTERVDNFNFVAGETNTRAHHDVIINNSDLLGTGKAANGA